MAEVRLVDLVVIKRYGAAIRVSPSSSAAIVSTLPCGTNMRVLGQSGGWYHVQTGGPRFNGWVGGARVGDAANPPSGAVARVLRR